MIKARYDANDGETTFLLGLSDGNLELLRQGKPMRISLEAMGGTPGTFVVIMWGKTEDDIQRDLVEAFGEPLQSIDRREPRQ